jgi:DNA-binding CsgD family transcriptional regulator
MSRSQSARTTVQTHPPVPRYPRRFSVASVWLQSCLQSCAIRPATIIKVAEIMNYAIVAKPHGKANALPRQDVPDPGPSSCPECGAIVRPGPGPGPGPGRPHFFLPLVAPPPQIATALSLMSRLSGRERTIFRLLGTGCDNRAIAQELRISERTVKRHMTAILGKLRLESRLQAGLAALASTPFLPAMAASAPPEVNGGDDAPSHATRAPVQYPRPAASAEERTPAAPGTSKAAACPRGPAVPRQHPGE